LLAAVNYRLIYKEREIVKKISAEDMKGIKISLISSFLFLVLIEPILKISKNLGKGVISAVIDFFYYSCAHTNWECVTGFCAFYIFAFFIIKIIGDSVPAAFPSTNQEINSTDTQETSCAPKSDTPDLNVLSQKIATVTSEIAELKQKKEKLKKLDQIFKWLSRINIVIQVSFFCYIMIFQYTAAAMSQSFDRRITQITPYTAPQRIEMIKSQWVQMESKSDYEIIKQEIDEILNENNKK